MAFKMKSKATKEAAKKATESGGGLKSFKMDKNKTTANLLVLGSVKEEMGAVFTAKCHELWKAGKPVHTCGTPSVDKLGNATGEKDPIVDTGWKLREKFLKSTNKKKKDFFKNFLLKTKHFVNVLDLDNLEAGPQCYLMPSSVADVVLEEFNEVGEDISSICGFDEGRILYIKHNGGEKLARKYKVVKFKNETANLLEDGALTEEDLVEIEKKLYDLSRHQPAYSETEFEKHLEHLGKAAQALGIDLEDLITDEEDEDLEEEYEDGDDDEIVDDDDDEIVDDEEEEAAEDDEEVEDDEEEADEELEFDDEEEEAEEVKEKKVTKKAAKKVVSKPSSKKVGKKKVRRKQ